MLWVGQNAYAELDARSKGTQQSYLWDNTNFYMFKGDPPIQRPATGEPSHLRVPIPAKNAMPGMSASSTCSRSMPVLKVFHYKQTISTTALWMMSASREISYPKTPRNGHQVRLLLLRLQPKISSKYFILTARENPNSKILMNIWSPTLQNDHIPLICSHGDHFKLSWISKWLSSASTTC